MKHNRMMQEGNGETVFGPRDTNDMPFFDLLFGMWYPPPMRGPAVP